jgi:hypothetical protein
MRENSGLIPKDNEVVKLDILEKRKALKNKTKDNENNFEKEQTNELRSIDTGKFKNKLDEMLKNKDALLIPKGNYFYIDYATVKQLILDNYPDINLNDYIKSILDSDIIILEDVEGEHLYKLNLS